LSYVPRYFDNIEAARSIIRSNVPYDLRDGLTDADIDVHLEQTELYVDDFLVSSGFDLTNLDAETKANGRILHTYRCLLSLLNIFALKEPLKTRLESRWEDASTEVERRLISRKFPTRLIKPVFKRIAPGWAIAREYAEKWGKEYSE